MSIDQSGVPDELVQQDQWIGWVARERDGDKTKTPTDFNGRNIDPTDPDNWSPFFPALQAVRDGDVDGIGFCFDEDGEYVGIDLDDCRDPDSGEITREDAQVWLNKCDGFVEISPSGTGIHIITKGDHPGPVKRQGKIEIYDRKRFFTVTGNVADSTGTPIDEAPSEVPEDQEGLQEAYDETFDYGDDETGETGHTLQDTDFSPDGFDEADLGSQGLLGKPQYGVPQREILPERDQEVWGQALLSDNRAILQALFNHDKAAADKHHPNGGKYPSQSERDMAFACYLAFWTDSDPEQMDRIFRASALYRQKWDKKHYGNGATYGEGTIERAIQQTDDGYDPGYDGTSHDDDDDDSGGGPTGSRETEDQEGKNIAEGPNQNTKHRNSSGRNRNRRKRTRRSQQRDEQASQREPSQSNDSTETVDQGGESSRSRVEGDEVDADKPQSGSPDTPTTVADAKTSEQNGGYKDGSSGSNVGNDDQDDDTDSPTSVSIDSRVVEARVPDDSQADAKTEHSQGSSAEAQDSQQVSHSSGEDKSGQDDSNRRTRQDKRGPTVVDRGAGDSEHFNQELDSGGGIQVIQNRKEIDDDLSENLSDDDDHNEQNSEKGDEMKDSDETPQSTEQTSNKGEPSEEPDGDSGSKGDEGGEKQSQKTQKAGEESESTDQESQSEGSEDSDEEEGEEPVVDVTDDSEVRAALEELNGELDGQLVFLDEGVKNLTGVRASSEVAIIPAEHIETVVRLESMFDQLRREIEGLKKDRQGDMDVYEQEINRLEREVRMYEEKIDVLSKLVYLMAEQGNSVIFDHIAEIAGKTGGPPQSVPAVDNLIKKLEESEGTASYEGHLEDSEGNELPPEAEDGFMNMTETDSGNSQEEEEIAKGDTEPPDNSGQLPSGQSAVDRGQTVDHEDRAGEDQHPDEDPLDTGDVNHPDKDSTIQKDEQDGDDGDSNDGIFSGLRG